MRVSKQTVYRPLRAGDLEAIRDSQSYGIAFSCYSSLRQGSSVPDAEIGD